MTATATRILLFNANGATGDTLTIVPLKPDFAYETHNDFSSSNLYCYGGAPFGPAPSAGKGEDVGNSAVTNPLCLVPMAVAYPCR